MVLVAACFCGRVTLVVEGPASCVVLVTLSRSAGGDEARRLMEEVYRDMVSPDELAKLDTQPNPFNFSERVSQTNRFSRRVS